MKPGLEFVTAPAVKESNERPAFVFFASISLALIIVLFVGLALAARGIAALEQDNARLREACGVKDGAL